jgi:hypothetical protein
MSNDINVSSWMTVTNKERVLIQDTDIDVYRSILYYDPKNEKSMIQYFNMEICQRIDTSVITKITINSVTKADMLELARKIQLLAESFQ